MKHIFNIYFIVVASSIFAQHIDESFEGTFPPNGWSVEHYGSQSHDWELSSINPKTGSMHASSDRVREDQEGRLILNAQFDDWSSFFSYWVAPGKMWDTELFCGVLKVYAAGEGQLSNKSEWILLRTINLNDANIFTNLNGYVQFTDYIDGTPNQSTNSIDLRGEIGYIIWLYTGPNELLTTCLLDDVTIEYAQIIPTFGIDFYIKVYLEGPYNSSLNEMQSDLNNIPLTSPYPEDPQSVSFMFSDVVDWVLVELRDKRDPSNIIASKSAFVIENGDVIDISGGSSLYFDVPIDDYFISIKHRNHLSIMSATTVEAY